MDPVTLSALINTGGNLFGGLASYFGNRGAYKEAQGDYRSARSGLMGMLGKDIFNPQGILAQMDVNAIPNLRGYAGQIAKQGGNLTSPDALGALFEKLQGNRNSILAQLMQSNAQGKANRDFDIRSMVFNNAANNLARF